MSASPAEADIPINDVLSPCDTTTVGTTITLDADCVTTEPLTIPDGFTLDGADLTITAETAVGAETWLGAVVTNADGAMSMNIENVRITGPAAGFPFPANANSCNTHPAGAGLFGIFFNDASGSVNNVVVDNIFQQETAFPACQVGHAIRADGVTADHTVTITDTQVLHYQKAGLFASGRMTMNVSDNTIVGPASPGFSNAVNDVNYTNTSTNSEPAVGASGTITDSTIIGTSFVSTGPADPATNATAAVLLWGANNVIIDSNTITGGSDYGVSATFSTDVTISFNAIGRSTMPVPPDPDLWGVGVSVWESTTSLICNTFSGWNLNIELAMQISCVPLPNGFECQNYSADVLGVEGGTADFTWSVVSGTLPPGLSMDPETGAITGIPTAVGAFNFDVQVVDSSEAILTATTPQTITVAAGCEADLALTKVVSNASPNVGDQVTFTVTLANNGPDTATNVQVTDLVPAGMTLVSATPSQGTYDSATGLWTVGTTDTPQTLQLVVTIASTDAQTNTATISASDQPDPNIDNNTASASVAPPTTTTTTTTPAVLPPAPTTTIAGASGVLPPTGSGGRSVLYVAVAALALGSLVVVVTRRRARA